MTLSSSNLRRVRPPGKTEELGVPAGLIEDLFLRRVLTERITSIGEVADLLHVTHPLADELASTLREKRLIEYLGASGRDYRIQLTELGHRTTTQRMSSGRHVGGIPVALGDYQEVVAAQRSDVLLDRELIKAAFEDLVLADDLLDQIGPAFVGNGAMFLYGPAGTGKTSVAERLNRIFDDPVLIPHHIETDGQIISVYDPALHRAVDEQPEQIDRRWVLCERPLIIVGGELDMSMLDLHHDRISGVNIAPIQLLANNGILVVDDFGRQAVRPDAILNRWIVPLSRGIDFLKVSSGSKFTVPFELKLVISTNLDPTSLGDDAFLRRLRNKVYVGPITEEQFITILKRAAAAYEVQLTTGAAEYLCEIARHRVGELRPYLAVDFCELTEATCRYERAPNVLNPDMVDRIADLYFVQEVGTDDIADSAEGAVEDFDVEQQVEQWGHGGVDRRSRVAPVSWSDYEIGPDDDHPLAGLDALADTQSVEGLDPVEGVPEALQPSSSDTESST
jgi:hypothetical protein